MYVPTAQDPIQKIKDFFNTTGLNYYVEPWDEVNGVTVYKMVVVLKNVRKTFTGLENVEVIGKDDQFTIIHRENHLVLIYSGTNSAMTYIEGVQIEKRDVDFDAENREVLVDLLFTV